MKKTVQIAFAIALVIISVISSIWQTDLIGNIIYAVVLPSFILSIISFIAEISEKCETDGEKLYNLSIRCADMSKEIAELKIKSKVETTDSKLTLEEAITPEINEKLTESNKYAAEALGYQKVRIFCLKCKRHCDRALIGGYVLLFLSLALSPYIAKWLSVINLNCITLWSLSLLYISLELKSEVCSKVFHWLSEKHIKRAKAEYTEEL